METKYVADVLKEDIVDIVDKFLVATTIHDGYTGIHPGDHVFKVVAEGEDLVVVPMVKELQGTEEVVVEGKETVIRTDGNIILFSARTLDPYDFPYTGSFEIKGDKAKAVLNAFREFANQEFSLGGKHAYHILLADQVKLVGEPTPVEPEPTEPEPTEPEPTV